ncbi:MAG: Electron transport complex subunit RsxC [Candidatus Erwinia impunctatus]|nr:Electron transport complex subunit RsxC [Culicoides impunctatus]
MRNFFTASSKKTLWDFPGGIHPPEMKSQSNETPLRQLPLADRFIIPLKQHIGSEGELLVAPGDRVLRGSPLTFGQGRMLPVHAPTSGTIEAIIPHITAHPSALNEISVILIPDGEDRWCTRLPLPDYHQQPRSEIISRIHQSGVAGLGGAGFPTASKIRGGLRSVNTLIINAAECEPYITADDRLMRECAAEIIEGSRILAWVLQAERVLIGIEDNKPEAIRALNAVIGKSDDIQLCVIPTKYPSGGAKQLTKILTGMEVPHGGRSTDIGILMQNVGTAYAVKRAVVDGEPLTERVVTVTGEAVSQPGNVWGRLGTPVCHALRHSGFTPGAQQLVIMGGPLMGFTLPDLSVPVVKITNCLLAPSAQEFGPVEREKSCIRCSACADACPAALLPQQLYWYSRGQDHQKAREHNIDDCIECGACAYVCPSDIPLVQYYRQEKAEIRAIDLEAERAALAKQRFEARQQRLDREKTAREQRHLQAKRAASSAHQDSITAALTRLKDKDQAAHSLAEERAIDAAQQQTNAPASQHVAVPRQAAVAAAIARAKAKKALTESSETSPVDVTHESAEDPRKAAVAAAIARAKAKKALTESSETSPVDVTHESAEDPRKAAVAAAIARAKAKKALTESSETSPVDVTHESAEDPRKAAVAAAIARAKAKKVLTEQRDKTPSDNVSNTSTLSPSVDTKNTPPVSRED